MPNFDDMMDEGKDIFNAWNEGRKKRSNELSTTVITEGATSNFADKLLHSVSIYQQNDGYIYFNKDDSKLFELLEYHWNGPKYKIVSESKTVGKKKGKEKTKVKRKGRVTGAIVGSLAMPVPGVGAAMGAMHGTGNKEIKGKNKEKNESHTYATEEQIEVPTPAFIRVRNIITNEETTFNFQCTTEIDIILSQFTIFNHNNDTMYNEPQTNDPYEEIKKAKELLDMGIITQDEFDQKKKELLGL